MLSAYLHACLLKGVIDYHWLIDWLIDWTAVEPQIVTLWQSEIFTLMQRRVLTVNEPQLRNIALNDSLHLQPRTTYILQYIGLSLASYVVCMTTIHVFYVINSLMHFCPYALYDVRSDYVVRLLLAFSCCRYSNRNQRNNSRTFNLRENRSPRVSKTWAFSSFIVNVCIFSNCVEFLFYCSCFCNCIHILCTHFFYTYVHMCTCCLWVKCSHT